jgi:AraC-like DNA-binding protein
MLPNPLYYYPGNGVFCVHSSDEQFALPHVHAHIQVEYLIKLHGSVIVENSTEKVKLTEPTVVIHSPYTLHRAHTTDDHTGLYDRYIINFQENLLDDFAGYLDLERIKGFGMKVIPIDEHTCENIKNCCEEILAANEKGELKRSVLILAVITDTIIKCMSECESGRYQSKIKYIYEVMEFIAKTLHLNLTLEEIADRFFISRAKLVADFKTVTGMSVKKYTTLMKVNMAKLMLSSGHSVSETAEACGFCDDSHFIITFKRSTNLTPKEYARHKNVEIG